MVRQVLFVQGGGETAHDGWDIRLVQSLRTNLGAGYDVSYPLMPAEGDPHRATWTPVIAAELDHAGPDVVVVGHSIGASILLDMLADPANRYAPSAIFCVATPFIGEGGWPAGELGDMRGIGSRLPACPIYFYQGDRDDIAPDHLSLFAQAIPQATTRLLPGRDHQLDDDLKEVAQDIAALG